MSRTVVILTSAALALTGTGAAHAADWGMPAYEDPVFKPSYPIDYEQPDSLEFEAGLRYFYSWGSQSFAFGGDTYSATDTSHALEAHLRIDDRSTSTYVKGHVGFGAITD